MENYTELFLRCAPLLVKGMRMSIEVFLYAASLSFVLGLLFGIVTCHRLRVPLFSTLIEGITFVYRAVPFYVQLLIVYFVLPDLLGFNLEPFPASVIALGMCSSGYVAQTVRAGINSIPVAQWEAAFALGYNKLQSLRQVILPQMVRNVD